jgi:hypothetical protein
LKNGKAIEHDQILPSFITEGGKELRKVTYELILKMWKKLYRMSGNMA